MKGIAIQTIGFFMIALIGVFLLIMFVSTPLRKFANDAFCFFYKMISPGGSGFCINLPSAFPPEEINADTPDELAREVAARIILCWNEGIKPLQKGDISCYQLILKNNPGPVSEEFMTQLMEREGGCDAIQNADVIDGLGNIIAYNGNCGVKDQIEWDVSGYAIDQHSLILIKYDSQNRRIVVKG